MAGKNDPPLASIELVTVTPGRVPVACVVLVDGEPVAQLPLVEWRRIASVQEPEMVHLILHGKHVKDREVHAWPG